MSQGNGSDSDFISACSSRFFRRLQVLLRAMQSSSGIGDSGSGFGSGSGNDSEFGLVLGIPVMFLLSLPKSVRPVYIKEKKL